MKKTGFVSVFLSALLTCGLSSCFTGIEGTKKISLSREDRKKVNPTPEESFLSGISPLSLKDWTPGYRFVAADNKALLVFEPIRTSLFPDTTSIKGQQLEFAGVSSKVAPDGNLTVLILLTDGNREFAYDTMKNFDNAMESFTSADIPMLIDINMVEQAKELLMGKKLWTRSNLWYDENEQRIDGKKFFPVTVVDVLPGTMIFPLKLELTTQNGERFYMFMNYGNNNTDSRAFHNLFSLTDLRKQYPSILPETWDLICAGKIADGMTKQECRLALGNPIEVASGHDYSQTLDIWSYENGIVLWFEDGKLVRHKG